MNISLSIVAFVLTAITLFGAVLFGKSLKDFYDTLKNIRRDVDGIVRQQVEQEIGVVIRNRVDRLETILAREAILGRVTVDYVIPTDQLQILPPELKFLQTRGFQTTPKIIAPTQLASLPLPADVIVLDLFNAGITTEAQAEPIITTLISKLPYKQAVLVVYIVGFHSQTLNTVIANGHLCIPAQSPLSLVGRVIDAAYVADAL